MSGPGPLTSYNSKPSGIGALAEQKTPSASSNQGERLRRGSCRMPIRIATAPEQPIRTWKDVSHHAVRGDSM